MSYTLNIDPEIIRKGESYALRNGTTLDALIRACAIVIASQGEVKSDLEVMPRRSLQPLRGEKPCIADLIGYGARFHTPRSTEEWMKELREGEEE